jgi:hypothetical protein
VIRQDASALYRRFIGPRWFWKVNASGDSNAELNLDLRATIGTGVGRFFARSNQLRFAGSAGPAYSIERYSQQAARDLSLGVVSLLFEYFTERLWQTDVSVSMDFLPVLNQSGRIRMEGDIEGRHEIVKDFFIKLRVFASLDSRPPTDGTTKQSDFGITTSLGWQFK